jgi:hypothetical protein
MKREVPAILSEAGGSCHSGQAKRDPESSPARSGIQRILDSGLRRNDGVSDFCKSFKKQLFGAERAENLAMVKTITNECKNLNLSTFDFYYDS